MKKAVIVKAVVMTRVITDVETDKEFDNAVELAKERLLFNLNNDYYDCIESVEEDKEMPYVTKYKWVASSDDGAYEEESGVFDTHKECYNDMRRKALLKMEWNTELEEDFIDGTKSIGYKVLFSPNQITHKSYSGLYTYKVVEI